MAKDDLPESRRQVVREEFEKGELGTAVSLAEVGCPDDAGLLSWATETFRDLELIGDDEELYEAPYGYRVREVARVEECPVCGDETDHVVDEPEKLKTPSQIDSQWEVCVSNSTLYIHNFGVGDYLGRENR